MTRTNKQLENILLVKTVNRFRKTKLSQVDSQISENSEYHIEKYTIEVNGFKLKLSLSKNLAKNSDEYKLWVIKPDGYLFEAFESNNENYAPILKQMYEDVTARIANSQKKDQKREEREFNRKLRKLDRII
jgi:hypothetical protein